MGVEGYSGEGLTLPAERWHEVCMFMGRAANHEAEIVTGLVLANEPCRAFSAMRLRNAIIRRQGSEPGWVQGRATALDYCRNSLEPAGYAVRDYIDGGPQDAYTVLGYRFNPDSPRYFVPTLGVVADWSLRYPNLSVQQLLGRTSPRGVALPAESRINTFMSLLTAPDMAEAIDDIQGISTLARKKGSVIDDLRADGIVLVDNVDEDNDRQFRLHDPCYRGNTPFGRLSHETQFTYQFFGSLEVGQSFTKQQLLDYVLQQLRTHYPGSDLTIARNRLNVLVCQPACLRGIERLGNYNGSKLTKTRVTIHPGHITPIHDLMDRVVRLSDGDSGMLAYGQQRAGTIINDPALVSKLMAKAYRFSNLAQSKGANANMSAIRLLIEAADCPLTKDEVVRHAQERGLRLGQRAVAGYLRSLEERQEISATSEPKDDTTRQSVKRYRSHAAT